MPGTRIQPVSPCIARLILNHWATREVQRVRILRKTQFMGNHEVFLKVTLRQSLVKSIICRSYEK